MPDRFEKKNIDIIYLDTEFLIRLKFNFRNPDLIKLKKLSCEKQVYLFIFDVTIKEATKHLEASIRATYNHLKKLRQSNNEEKLLPVIKGFDSIQYLKDNKVDEVIDEGKKELNQFIRDSNFEILNINPDITNKVFDQFFLKEPPFSESKQKEFPDAFVLNSIESWSETQEEKVNVISGDPDWKKFSEQSHALIYHNDLKEILSKLSIIERNALKFIKDIPDDELVDYLYDAIDAVSGNINYFSGNDDEIVEAKIKEIFIQDYKIIELNEGHGAIDFDVEIVVDVDLCRDIKRVYTQKNGSEGSYDDSYYYSKTYEFYITVGTLLNYELKSKLLEFHKTIYFDEREMALELPNN